MVIEVTPRGPICTTASAWFHRDVFFFGVAFSGWVKRKENPPPFWQDVLFFWVAFSGWVKRKEPPLPFWQDVLFFGG